MLFRFIAKSSHLRVLTLISSQTHFSNPKLYTLRSPLTPSIPNPRRNFFLETSTRHFSTDDGGNGEHPSTSTSDLWKLSLESDQSIDSVFGEDTGSSEGFQDDDSTSHRNVDVSATKSQDESWFRESTVRGGDETHDIFKGNDDERGKGIGVGEVGGGVGNEKWATSKGFKPWNLAAEEKVEGVFDFGEDRGLSELQDLEVEDKRLDDKKSEEDKQLEIEEKTLSAILKGPNRAFGDLIAASGITEEMLDSLIALKDLGDIKGLPPLREIEVMRYEKNTRKSSRADIERQKQEEIAKARVRLVDEKGRAYGTGRRKCSIARVWVQPGEGKFTVNDQEFDVYFRDLDHRAALLRPFSETETVGLWDVKCTVKGGGVSGQVGAIQLGVSRALQNWEPQLRPPLRSAGFLTRDSRVVERKKPGKAKARKSFQWVKR